MNSIFNSSKKLIALLLLTTLVACGGVSGESPADTANLSRIAVWTSCPTDVLNGGPKTVYIDGGGVGALTTAYASNAGLTCDSIGALTTTVSTGSHLVSARDGTGSWSPVTVTVPQATCVSKELKC